MRKIFSLSLLCASALTLMTSCAGEEDDIFDASAAERLNQTSAVYSARLEAQPNGWAMQFYPTTRDEAPYGSGYLLLMDFDADYSVRVAMNNRFSNNTYSVSRSPWEVITDNGPVLSFNGFNECLHKFSDPEDISWTGDSDNPNNEQGEGCGGDYEFIIVDAPEDASYMMLKGKKRGTYNLLTPLEEGVDYREYLTEVNDFMAKMFPVNYPSFDVIHFGDSIYKMEGADDGVPNIYPYDADAITYASFNPFLVTKRGTEFYLRFRDKKEFPDGVSVQDFHYNTEKDIFESVDNENYYIEGSSPYEFYVSVVDAGRQRWQWDETSMMSDSFKSYFDAVAEGFKQFKYTLQNMCYLMNKEQAILRVQYKDNKNVLKTVMFKFDMSYDGEGITYRFAEDYDKVSTNVRNSMPSLEQMLNALGGKWIPSGGETKFDLRKIRLVSSTDANLWFVTSLY